MENPSSHLLSVVVEGSIGPEFEQILPGTPLFSPDGRHFAYAAALQQRYQVLLDGFVSPEYELVGHLTFSPDSRHFAYAAQKEKRRFVVYDGVPGPSFDDVFPAGFSPDSRHLIYYATQGDTQRIVVDQTPGLEYQTIGPLRFLPPAGDRPLSIMYMVLKGKELIRVVQPLPE